MKVLLTLQERVSLFDLINKVNSGNAAYWRMVDEAKGVLALSEEDHKVFGIKIKDGSMFSENKTKAAEKIEYELPERIVITIKEQLEESDAKKTLDKAQYIMFEALGCGK